MKMKLAIAKIVLNVFATNFISYYHWLNQKNIHDSFLFSHWTLFIFARHPAMSFDEKNSVLMYTITGALLMKITACSDQCK
jgi:hypothetical protein